MFTMSTTSLHTSWQRRRHWRIAAVTTACCTDVTILSSLSTALPSKQEKIFNYPPAFLSNVMEHAKIYESRCKIIWNIRRKRVTAFSGQCNLRFLSTKVLQGSVAMRVNYGRIFIDFFTANLPQSVMVKEFWKSVSISQSYRQKYSGTFFSGHGVDSLGYISAAESIGVSSLTCTQCAIKLPNLVK